MDNGFEIERFFTRDTDVCIWRNPSLREISQIDGLVSRFVTTSSTATNLCLRPSSRLVAARRA